MTTSITERTCEGCAADTSVYVGYAAGKIVDGVYLVKWLCSDCGDAHKATLPVVHFRSLTASDYEDEDLAWERAWRLGQTDEQQFDNYGYQDAAG